MKLFFLASLRYFICCLITISYVHAFSYAYVINERDKNIYIISLADRKLVNIIPVGEVPQKIILSSDKKGGYITDGKANHITVLDFSKDQIVAKLDTAVIPHTLAFVDKGRDLFIPNSQSKSDKVTVLSLQTREPEGDPIPAGDYPTDVLISKDGKQLYTLSKEAQTFTVIDHKAKKIDAVVKVGKLPVAMAITQDGKHAYVVNSGSNSVDIINLETQEKSNKVIFVGKLPQAIVLSFKHNRGYVVNSGDNNVTVFDLKTNLIIGDPIPVGAYPYGIALTPDENSAYVTNSQGMSMTQIDLATDRPYPDVIPTGIYPTSVVILDFPTQKLINPALIVPPKPIRGCPHGTSPCLVPVNEKVKVRPVAPVVHIPAPQPTPPKQDCPCKL